MYVKLKHLCRWTKTLASGEVRTYIYVRGTKEPLPGKEGSPEFMAAYYEAMKRRVKKAADQTTIHALIANYKASSQYTSLSGKTRRDYARYIKLIEDEFGTMPRAALDDPKVRGEFQRFRDFFSDNPRKADMVWTMLKRMFSVAVDQGELSVNPCRGGGRLYVSDRADKVWTEEHLARLFAKCSNKVRQVVIMALWTGQRQGNCLAMSKTAYTHQTGKIEVIKQSKSGKRMLIPAGEPLKRMLHTEIDWNSDATTILTNTYGDPWTEDGFRSSFATACKGAGIGAEFGEDNDLHFHDLRGTAITRMALVGCTVPEIASVTGHSEKTVHDMLSRHYLGGRAQLAEQAIAKLDALRLTQPSQTQK